MTIALSLWLEPISFVSIFFIPSRDVLFVSISDDDDELTEVDALSSLFRRCLILVDSIVVVIY
jgi:hypothetical protein